MEALAFFSGAMSHAVVSIGRLTAFYGVLVPMEFIPSKPPLYSYVIVSFCTLQKGYERPQILAPPPHCAGGLKHRYQCLQREQ